MKRTLAIALALLPSVGVAVFAGQRARRRLRSRQAGSLVGTGATFPFPLISKWIPAVDSALGIKITYSATGSGAGIAQITARTVDFGASDAPLSARTSSRPARAAWSSRGRSRACPSRTTFPASTRGLRSTAPCSRTSTSATSRNWNAAAIKALNPNANLPDLKITPVYRSDGSGSTYAFTDYLSAVSPQWKSKVGVNTSVNFPAGTGARGSSGVAGVVKSTAGALTYVDAAYSIKNKFQFALIQNRAGGFATPGVRGVTAALSTLPKKVTNLSQLKIVDPPKSAGKKAYPISTFTYVIVPTSSGDKAADLRKFVYWAVTAGQKFGPPLFFVPLPAAVNGFVYREIKKIQVVGDSARAA